MKKTKKKPTELELKKFAKTMAIAFPVVFGLTIPWIWDLTRPVWPWVLAAVFAVGYFVPKVLAPVHLVWMGIAEVLGKINSTIILGTVFFLLISPLAAIMRLFKYDPLLRRKGGEATSYRINPTTQDGPQVHMARPF